MKSSDKRELLLAAMLYYSPLGNFQMITFLSTTPTRFTTVYDNSRMITTCVS